MKKWFALVVVCGAFSLLVSCQKSATEENKRLVKIGGMVLTQKDVNAFSRVSQNYPTSPQEYAISSRNPITGFVETEAIYRKVRFSSANRKYRRTLDWQWKKQFIVAQNYMMDVLQRHLGYSETELRNYYDANKSEFMSPIVSDSAGTSCTTMVVSSFDDGDVKRQIAEKLFLTNYQPDSAFLASTPLNDENAVRGRWLKHMRFEGYRELFLKKFFKEKYGVTMPDSLDDLVGNGKVLSQDDMNVILSWIPENRRDMIRNNKQSLYDFARWLLRWRLFSEKAAATGYAAQADIKATVTWLWRYEIAQRHITEKLVPEAKKASRIDSSMARYSFWDEYGNPGTEPDSMNMANHFNRLIDQQTNEHFDGLLYSIRQKAKVRFLTKDWADERAKNPAAMLRQADSLRDTGKTSEAETIYRTLVTDFSFSPQAKKALVELAKLQTEQQIYTEAIRNYRRVLLVDADAGKRCNFMFMIGFIYDEYLDRPEMAEINYKWVLKNAPDCELADDAEFMMLHLGEQMTSVDELQAEVRRQGKKVEESDVDTTGLTVESEPAKKTAK
ncbi:MAG: tetratricopeptide repeat protein [Chitinispirillaceae bacterium]|nr:tetratricopeptide repeat protein [Chitinispirillaceae bacterium]